MRKNHFFILACSSVDGGGRSARPWETLGEIYWYTGNYEGCIDAMTRCIGISKEKYPEAYRFRGNSLIKLGKTAEATKDLKKTDKLDGK